MIQLPNKGTYSSQVTPRIEVIKHISVKMVNETLAKNPYEIAITVGLHYMMHKIGQ